jgi:phenylalanyl-tRNA synthetase beta chain
VEVSYAWLKAIAPGIRGNPEALAARLALRGSPVESVTALAEGLEGVVVARVEATERHPNADRLTLCTVDAGNGQRVRVVCGAPNVTAGGVYPFAPVGTVLPGNLRIERAKIRGETSEGMLCSARELGLGTDQSGLLELEARLKPGASLVKTLGLADWRLDVEITANRGDLLSHVGIAREAGARGHAGLRLPRIPYGKRFSPQLVRGRKSAAASGATVRIDAPELCSRYLGAVIRGVKVGPSPAWLQARLRAAGSRPINNVVDATNYVLLELGQPLHAFDLAKLADRTIVVRKPRAGEKTFKTLDGAERALAPDMLLICDAERPVALAGVMGGLDSEVTGATTDVLLECALFEPKSIRATRRALIMSTDASYRFERGVDPEGLETALARAVELIVATAGGKAEKRVADCHPRPFKRKTLKLRPERVARVLGVEFTPQHLGRLLKPLGFEIGKGKKEGALSVSVPGFRSYDVTREVDLIEEVARAHGYDAFPAALAGSRPGTVPDHPLFRLEDGLRDRLVARGLFEAHTPAFVGAAQGQVRLKNPISAEEAFLRASVLPSLLRRVEYNWSRGTRDVRLFELATAFAKADGGARVHEEPRLAAVLTGRSAPPHFSGPGEPYALWDLRGLLEDAARAAWPDGQVTPGAPQGRGVAPSEGFTVTAGGAMVGWGGRIESAQLDAPPWADPVFGLELRLPDDPGAPVAPRYRAIPPFPAVERDLALVVADRVPAADVEAAIRAQGGPLLQGVGLFDLYRGKGVPDGHRSLAYRLRFVSADRTLTDEEVDRSVQRVVEHLARVLGVERRA